jgi:ABC-type dipeptide/oligopeptide/nickel transport system permease subunit
VSATVPAPVAAPEAPQPVEPEAVKARGYWELIWIRFRRDRLAVGSFGFIVFLFFMAFVGAPIFAHLLGHGPETQFGYGATYPGPIPIGPWVHIPAIPYYAGPHPPAYLVHQYGTAFLPLGASDGLGHDMFLDLLYGAQVSLEVGVFATFLSVGLGVVMGLIAGYFRGWIDTVIAQMINVVMVFPYLLFIIALQIVAGPRLNAITLGFLPNGVFTLTLILSLFGWFYPARIMRGVTFSLREKEFIEAARMTGASDWRIMRSHLLPHLVAPIIVYSTILVAVNILAEAGLSFLGLGIPPGQPSWGNLLANAPTYYQTDVWILIFPGLAILFTTIAFNLLGDGLRDAFDPRGTI